MAILGEAFTVGRAWAGINTRGRHRVFRKVDEWVGCRRTLPALPPEVKVARQGEQMTFLSRVSRHWLPIAALGSMLAMPAPAQAPGDVRIALVIGNSAYPGPAALQNPAND